MNQSGGRQARFCALLIILLTIILAACGGGTGTGVVRNDTGNSAPGTPVKTPAGSAPPPPHTLTVQGVPSSGGTVLSNPSGISCGSACSTSFVSGTNVAVTVNPAQGFVFTGWGGACSGTGGCNVSMSSDQTVVANFGPAPTPQFNLSIALNGAGSGTVTSAPAGINCGATCNASFNSGTAIALTAVATPGSVFAGWSGAACSGTGSCTVTLTSDVAVTATFVPTFTLNVSKSGTGTGTITSAPAGINCGTSCSNGFSAGTVVALAATPATGSAFTGWSGACTGTGSCTVTLNSNQAVVANFGPPPTPQFTLSVTSAGAGAGSVTSAPVGINCGATCSAAFDSGTSVTITATPAAGSVFAGWSGSPCAGLGSCNVPMNSNVAVTATFLPLFSVSVTLAGTGTGTVTSLPAGINCGASCSATFSSGSTVSLAAVPASGSVFIGWSGACTGTGACSIALSSNQTVTATFGPAPLPPAMLTVTTSGAGTGSVVSTPAGINCGTTCAVSFANGSVVTLTPTPAAGSAFAGWSGACSGTGTCSVTLNSEQTVDANFIPTAFPINVTLAGTGSGSVASAPAGISCGATCSANFNTSTLITLTATPTGGSVFAGWSGAGCSGTGTCSFTMGTAAVPVTATFSPAPTFALAVSSTGTGTGTITSSPGTINCGATCSNSFNQGTVVTLTPTAVAGSVFNGWSGACTGTGACSVTMNSAQSVSADFIPTSFPVNVTLAGTGSGSVASAPAGISCGATCSANFNTSTLITLTATPTGGSVFAGWSGAGCSGTGTCSFTMGTAAVPVKATFQPPPPPLQFTLTTTLSGTGFGSISSSPAGINCGVTCSADFATGTVVTLTPTAAAGSVFNGWSGACSGTGTCSVTMNSSQTVSANFIPASFPVNVTLAGTGSGSVASAPAGISCGATCSANFNTSTLITLTATPAAGSVFAGWSGACSGTGTCSFIMGTASVGVTATFSPAPQYTLTVNKPGTGTGTITSSPGTINCGATCSNSFNQGTVVTLTATAAAGSVFAGWSGACTGSGACSVTMNSSQSVSASFITTSFPVNVTLAGTGSGSVASAPAGISCGATCSANFNTSTLITLTATPAAGSVFAGWSGACSGTGTCSFTMGTASVGVTAAFSPASTFTLSVSKTGTGSGTITSSPGAINCGATCSSSFLSGATVTLTAVPQSGSVFTGWSGGGCAGTGTCTVTVSSSFSVAANFVPRVTMTVTLAGTGSGSVTSAPAGINCGATCSATYTSGTTVSLAATPASGSVFGGWSGGCSGTGACNLTLNSNQTVTATFNPAPTPQFTFSLALSGSGAGTVTSSPAGINCGTVCSAPFTQGTSVTFTATPAAGFAFTGWSGSACTGTGTCSVTISADTSMTANFAPLFTLAVTPAGTGTGTVSSTPTGITCGATCSATYVSGSSVSLTAGPASGSVFTGWSGACSGTGSCVVNMSSNMGVTATFGPAPPPQYAVTVTNSGTGTGNVTSVDGKINCGSTCSASYASGTTIGLTATPSSGSAFAGWSSALCSGTSPCTMNVNSPQNVTANFVPVATLTVTLTGLTNGGVVTSSPLGIQCPSQCASNFNQGTSVTITAVPLSGYGFNGWSGACSGTSTTCTVSMSGAQNVSADFQALKSVASPFLSASPSPFNFGAVQNNTTSTQAVTISNTGPSNGGNLIISAATVDNSQFAIPAGQFPMTIAPGSGQPLNISFSPTASGSMSGTVTFTSNASNPTTTILLAGNGSTTTTAAGALNITPTTVFFGNVNVGSTATQTVTMSNPGTASTVISTATVSGSGFTIVSPAFPLTLAAGATQVVTISFSAQSTGSVTGVITFTSNASSSSPVASIVASANGTSPVTSAAVLPTDLSFGAVPMGATYLQNLTVYNTGNTSLTVNDATLTGSGFSINAGAFPFTIAVNGSQAVTVGFTAFTAGTSSGTLALNTTAPNPQPTVNLSGTGAFASAHTATLSWTASSSAVIGYNVYRSTTPGTGYQLLAFVTSTTFADSNVTSGQTYYWVVTAVSARGVQSTYSTQVSATILIP